MGDLSTFDIVAVGVVVLCIVGFCALHAWWKL